MRVITFGTFDLFHVGHLRVLRRAKELGSHLVVGVSTDDLNVEKKGRLPVYSEAERLEIVAGCRHVDEVFLERSMDEKRRYITDHAADILVMGNDWAGEFDHLADVCDVVYLDRTPSVSTTATIEVISLGRGSSRGQFSAEEGEASRTH